MEYIPELVPLIRYLAIFLLIVFTYYIIIRPLTKNLSKSSDQKGKQAESKYSPEKMKEMVHELNSTSDLKKKKCLREEIAKWAKENPEEATHLLQKWIEKS